MPEQVISRSSRRSLLLRAGLLLVLGFYLAHGGIIIARSSFEIDGQRYFCLFDDAMISLTYARNLAEGYGLVWNPGQAPVEGYTNFLWVLILTPFHWLGLSESGVCLAVHVFGLLLGATGLMGGARVGVALRAPAGTIVAGTALVATVSSLELLSVGGMETPLAVALVTFALAGAIRCLHDGHVRVTPFILLALGCLVRMDLILCLGVITLMLLWGCRRSAIRIALYSALAVVPLALQAIWRHGYYGEWLPNTYYAKLSGWPLSDRLARGARESARILFRYGPALLVCAAGLAARPTAHRFLIAGLFGALLAYSTWVGGDVWPLDRFVAPAVPALLLVTALHLTSFVRPAGHGETPSSSALRWCVATAACALLVVTMNFENRWQTLLVDRPWYRGKNIMNVTRALAIRQATEPDATIGMYYAGATPYFARRSGVDFLGKADAYIAHYPIRVTWRESGAMPGHNKWSWPWSIGVLKPDVITRSDGQLLLYSPDFQDHYERWRLKSHAEDSYGFWVRTGSPRIRWSELERTRDWKPGRSRRIDDPGAYPAGR